MAKLNKKFQEKNNLAKCLLLSNVYRYTQSISHNDLAKVNS